jgi:hypothetical protein
MLNLPLGSESLTSVNCSGRHINVIPLRSLRPVTQSIGGLDYTWALLAYMTGALKRYSGKRLGTR